MALTKQPVPINFAGGLDLKTDPNQVAIGKFLALNNMVFNSVGALTKRNGYPIITTLPNVNQTTLTTLNDNLLATGSDLYAFSKDTDQWLNQGTIQPVQLSTQTLVRASTSQSGEDMAVAANGLAILSYTDSGAAYYQVSDTTTGQQIVQRTALGSTATNPRVFVLGRYFIITFAQTIGGLTHLRYISIPWVTPLLPNAPQDIATNMQSLTIGYDGFVANNNLYVAFGSTATTVKVQYVTSTLVVSSQMTITGQEGDLISVTADTSASTAVVWVIIYTTSSKAVVAAAYSQMLAPILAATNLAVPANPLVTLTSIATDSVCTIILDTYNTFTYAPNAQTDYLRKVTITQSGTVGANSVILRSVGAASKPFVDNGVYYMIAAYGEFNQPTYFLIDLLGNVYMRLAYSNGGGFDSSQILPSVSSLAGDYLVPYLIKDFLATVNKGTNLPAGTPVNGIYTQTGINLAQFSINTTGQYSSQIANTLHLTGGQLWQYDGVRPVEHGFQVWPEDVAGTFSTTGGMMAAQPSGYVAGQDPYYYQFTYEWTDNQGNLHRSAPSIPLGIPTSGTGSTGSVTLNVPTLRLTYKLAPNPVRIVGYRWSVAQQVYYQFTSITNPVINDPTVDSVTIVDTNSDAAILGQTILYTTGGVVEDIAAPASSGSTLFNNRLWLIDAEDPNLLWFSKQVIEAVPVEMSDLLTLYVAPTSGAQGSTGNITALAPMDDKLIIFKPDAAYYINGTGPDNTGANSSFSDPIFITASVGCSNPNSIALMPMGLMFQSDKGIWLLGRDLTTTYIGDAVEAYNSQTIVSATAIPGTNQVRFVLESGTTLVYDYYRQQWSTFSNVQAISATLYQGAHTYLNVYGSVFQEAKGTYTDGSTPVLMSFTTAWMSLAGLQGYERFYQLLLLGTYYTPFKLNVTLAYDYNPSATQAILVSPDNYTPNWGGDAQWGSNTEWGGPGNIFQARVFPQTQKCETFQISIAEVYDSTFGVSPGQGLTLSGLNAVIGVKKGYRTATAGHSFG